MTSCPCLSRMPRNKWGEPLQDARPRTLYSRINNIYCRATWLRMRLRILFLRTFSRSRNWLFWMCMGWFRHLSRSSSVLLGIRPWRRSPDLETWLFYLVYEFLRFDFLTKNHFLSNHVQDYSTSGCRRKHNGDSWSSNRFWRSCFPCSFRNLGPRWHPLRKGWFHYIFLLPRVQPLWLSLPRNWFEP